MHVSTCNNLWWLSLLGYQNIMIKAMTVGKLYLSDLCYRTGFLKSVNFDIVHDLAISTMNLMPNIYSYWILTLCLHNFSAFLVFQFLAFFNKTQNQISLFSLIRFLKIRSTALDPCRFYHFYLLWLLYTTS